MIHITVVISPGLNNHSCCIEGSHVWLWAPLSGWLLLLWAVSFPSRAEWCHIRLLCASPSGWFCYYRWYFFKVLVDFCFWMCFYLFTDSTWCHILLGTRPWFCICGRFQLGKAYLGLKFTKCRMSWINPSINQPIITQELAIHKQSSIESIFWSSKDSVINRRWWMTCQMSAMNRAIE